MPRKSKYIKRRMLEIASQVELHPGKTAYWHRPEHCRMGYLYAAFERAERYGLIRGEWNAGKTRKVYFYVPDWREQYPDLCK